MAPAVLTHQSSVTSIKVPASIISIPAGKLVSMKEMYSLAAFGYFWGGNVALLGVSKNGYLQFHVLFSTL